VSFRPALICNPGSGSVEKRGSVLECAALARPDIPFVTVDDFDNLPALVGALGRDGVNTFVIEGGDGTLKAVLTAAECTPEFASPPAIAMLPGGSTNLACKVMGLRRPDAAGVAALMERLDAGHTGECVSQPALTIETDGGGREAGFLLSTGSAARAMLYAKREVLGRGARGSLAVVMTALRLLAAPQKTFDQDGAPVLGASRLVLDAGGAHYDGEHAFALMTTLPHLNLGLKPFWGAGEGAVAVTHARWPVDGLRRAALRIAFGQAGPMCEKHGLTSLRAHALTFRHCDRVVLDGEALPCPPDGEFRVGATAPVRFLR